MALAGGVSISFPQKRGYLYQPDGMVSPDGHCRTFDAKAQGTVFGSGAAVVLLKRLEDAVADGDHVYAVIKGFAVNNDGSAKVGYAAPSVEGQSEVIAMAQAAAGISPESVSYIECHGTATPLGDPIEIAAATKAFRASTQAKGFCAIGTAKTNVGHLDVAAGATGLIKTVLSLKNELLPPVLHFEQPNAKLELDKSPFYVNSKLAPWKRKQEPRRAGVSAFGVGGTNAHVVVEEAPQREASQSQRESQLLVLSAKTAAALTKTCSNLAGHLRTHSDLNLADVAHTLQMGRRHFEHRRFVIASSVADAIQALENGDNKRTGVAKQEQPSVVFMFPGQGAQYQNMGEQIYCSEKEFRKWVDACAEILKADLPRDLREVLYSKTPDSEDTKRLLTSTVFAQPAIFVTEYALAKLWMSWGIRPDAMIGHSIGEFVAACLGGVFSLKDALHLIATRGRLMQNLPGGSMLAVRLPESEVRPMLSAKLSIAAINTPALCVVSGPEKNIAELEEFLKQRGVAARHLHTSHAFHSAMMDPVIEPFIEVVKQITLKPTTIPYVSGVSGQWVTTEQVTNPTYWATHLREPVRFADSIHTLSTMPSPVLLEVGPGNTLATLASQHPSKRPDQIVIPSLPDAARVIADEESVLNALGKLWIAGIQPDWAGFHQHERLQRVPLPTYPFERKRYWVEPKTSITKPSLDSQQIYRTDQPQFPPEPPAEIIAAVCNREDETMAISQTGTSPAVPRRESIQQTLLSMFQDLSGISVADIDPSANFMELGFDSLFLTQAAQELQNKFAVKITFRQLLDQQSSIGALAEYLDGKLPAETVTASAPLQVAAKPASQPVLAPAPIAATSASSSAIESMMKEQLRAMSELMARQLEALKGSGTATPQIQSAVSASAMGPVISSATPQSAVKVEAVSSAVPAKEEPKAFGPYKPLSKGPAGGLTLQQERHIADLIARYIKKTPQSKALTQKYRKVMADPRVCVRIPFAMERNCLSADDSAVRRLKAL